MIWKNKPDISVLNDISKATSVEHLGIQFIELGDDYLVGSMPVDHRTIQPAGILHGGASVLLAETLGSLASSLCIEDLGKKVPVGIEINASHLKSVSRGMVYGRATAVRIGQKVHVWNIDITDESEDIICSCRLTNMILDRK